ncbi:hypothetical protein [Vreelandella titanicae]|uniref:hypothetical protein n=1 Tax=Vreelandella titanicae TaxID=664683 RepID=UPI0005868052|nr:hypothetical protein [Halomonas titanicae]
MTMTSVRSSKAAFILVVGFISIFTAQTANSEDNLTPVACQFEHLPLMLIISRDGMGGQNNTLQIGDNEPVQLFIGSSLMNAEFQGQSYVFSLRIPANVTVGSLTYHGTCISSPRR